jgi:hypothetical protein
MGATGSKDKLGGSTSLGAMGGMGSGGGGGGVGELQSPELKCAVPVAFRWHHGAQREVYVVGSFSNWQTKIRLTRWVVHGHAPHRTGPTKQSATDTARKKAIEQLNHFMRSLCVLNSLAPWCARTSAWAVHFLKSDSVKMLVLWLQGGRFGCIYNGSPDRSWTAPI